jgi:hypothetical protein
VLHRGDTGGHRGARQTGRLGQGGCARLLAGADYTHGVPKKKVELVFEKLRTVRGLSVEEKWLFAKTLAATPDERWQMHENFLRSHGLFTRSERKRYGFK